jgi:hypothetical protein
MEKWNVMNLHRVPTGDLRLATANWRLPTADFLLLFALCALHNNTNFKLNKR